MTRKIAVLTGSRSGYSNLYWVLKEIQARPSLELQLLVTGMHLSPEFGLTYRQIEEDGFPIHEKLEILLSGDSATAISTSIGLGLIRFSGSLENCRPDILVLLGDRFETLAAAIAAQVARIPVAHIGGGHRTEGAIDEAIRHSITKMSHLHLTDMPVYRDRVVQMGEQPHRVFITGVAGLDGIQRMRLNERAELEDRLELDLSGPVFLVVYHSVTLEDSTAGWQMDQLMSALSRFNHRCIFIMPNADTGGRIIFSKIEAFVTEHPTAKAFVNVDRESFLNLMRFADAMVGNSSAGILEAASFGLATVNIGDRQRGRFMPENVVSCGYETASIAQAIERTLAPGFKDSLKGMTNPYGDGHSSKRIVDILESVELGEKLLKKEFHDIRLNSELAEQPGGN